jgi:succinate dehydrogenase/fumarate reductase flavoprotein subunit
MPGQGDYADPEAGARDQGAAAGAETPRPIDEAISSARRRALRGAGWNAMLRALPGVFVAGEMVDWEAPTGGYLLTACFGSGRAAGQGALDWLRSQTLNPCSVLEADARRCRAADGALVRIAVDT